jgi:hypothetical protein
MAPGHMLAGCRVWHAGFGDNITHVSRHEAEGAAFIARHMLWWFAYVLQRARIWIHHHANEVARTVATEALNLACIRV